MKERIEMVGPAGRIKVKPGKVAYYTAKGYLLHEPTSAKMEPSEPKTTIIAYPDGDETKEIEPPEECQEGE